MASACVNSSPPPIPWLPLPPPSTNDNSTTPTPDNTILPDFEFRLDVPVGMLPADELFSDGKLVPLQMNTTPTTTTTTVVKTPPTDSTPPPAAEILSESSSPVVELSLVSPKAPRCSRKWREILGLKKQQLQNPSSHEKLVLSSSSSSSSSRNTTTTRSFRHFLIRNNNTTTTTTDSSSSLSLPLLRESDTDSSVSLSSSRFSLSSSSSSSCDSSDFARHSLDSDKPNQIIPVRAASHRTAGGPTRVRLSRPVRRVSADAESPRMNSCGKVVFNGGSLERSSSSPGSFNGRPRVRPRGMERSYSANVVRVNPVLNMPVCSLRGSGKPGGSVFGFFSSSEKKKEKEGATGKSIGINGGVKLKTEKATQESKVGKTLEIKDENM